MCIRDSTRTVTAWWSLRISTGREIIAELPIIRRNFRESLLFVAVVHGKRQRVGPRNSTSEIEGERMRATRLTIVLMLAFVAVSNAELYVVAHFPYGGGWGTRLLLTNGSPNPVTVELDYF